MKINIDLQTGREEDHFEYLYVSMEYMDELKLLSLDNVSCLTLYDRLLSAKALVKLKHLF